LKPDPSSSSSLALTSDAGRSNWAIVGRLFKLAWHYRLGCVAVLAVQVAVVAAELGVLGLTGLGIDALRYDLDPSGQPPRWPLGLARPL
jgi:hypothetical protein